MAIPEHLQVRLSQLRAQQRSRLLGPIAAYECVLGLNGFLYPFLEKKDDFAFYFALSMMNQAFWYFLVWELWKGRNWARIVMLILSALGPFQFFIAPMRHSPRNSLPNESTFDIAPNIRRFFGECVASRAGR